MWWSAEHFYNTCSNSNHGMHGLKNCPDVTGDLVWIHPDKILAEEGAKKGYHISNEDCSIEWKYCRRILGLRQVTACAVLRSSCAVLSVSNRGSYIILVVLCYFCSVQHQSDLAEALYLVSSITRALTESCGQTRQENSNRNPKRLRKCKLWREMESGVWSGKEITM